MTCIAGIVHNGKVYIGGDRAGVADYNLMVRKDSKVFRNEEFIIGFTSSFRMGQLLRYKLKPPCLLNEDGTSKDLYEYMVTDFVDAVRQCLKDGGFAIRKDYEESGGHFLVGYRDRMFHIGADYQVGESLSGMYAVGCGEHLALGSLYTSSMFELDPEKRITLALKAAQYFSAGVREPFDIIST
jgi:ATP-dependent protease HslVU (ClpYQ) peptidase subunit